MVYVKSYINKMNRDLLENGSIIQATDTLFRGLSLIFKPLQQIMVDAINTGNGVSPNLVLVKERGQQAEEHIHNPWLTNKNLKQLISKLDIREIYYLNSEENRKLFNYFDDKKGIDSHSFAIKGGITRSGYHFLVAMKIGQAVKGKFSSREAKDIINAYANVLDYHIRCLEYERSNQHLQQSYSNILELLVSLLELKDPYTCGHSSNVKKISLCMGRELGLSPEALEDLKTAAMLHDIGKVGIPEQILNKPSALNKKEFDKIKQHPVKGALLIANIPKLKKSATYILYHHERWDGSGYPMGLAQNQIPLPSRIISLADTYDAITSDRPYREKMSVRQAFHIISSQSSLQFDPDIVKLFFDIYNHKAGNINTKE
ncbi:MAG: HD-GYP domain-containing protein [Actinomycetota bacterium]|nr:HD-GYP domain-containing protein [Actinomycetota bacterium]